MKTVRIILSRDLQEQQVAFLSSVFEEEAVASSAIRKDNQDDEDWIMEWIMEHPGDPQTLQNRLITYAKYNAIDIEPFLLSDWMIEAVPEKNWLEETYRTFPPFSLGPFFIYGSHHKDIIDIPPEQMPLQIDAATAFGSGEHGTTKGCLEAMLDLKAQGICPWNILDMGTGSGILSVASWKLWKTPIVAVDIDEESVRVAHHHCDINHIKTGVSTVLCAQSDGFEQGVVQEKKPYELIIANILAGPLIEMAADLYKVCDENGYVILSGMLHEQADKVQNTYEAQGLTFKRRYERDEWTTLVMHKAS